MVCEKCGEQLRANAIVCDKCGEKNSFVPRAPKIIDNPSNKNSEKPQKPKKKIKVGFIITVVISIILVIGILAGAIVVEMRYKKAEELKSISPIEAYNFYDSISWYKDAEEKRDEQKDFILKAAETAISENHFDLAKTYLDFLDDYPGVSDVQKNLETAKKEYTYQRAVTLFDGGLYGTAKTEFNKVLGYKEVDSYLNKFVYKLGDYYSSVTMYEPFKQMYFSGNDTMLMGENGTINTYLYVVVESDEDYQCSRGDYEVWIVGEVINGKEIYFDYPSDIFGISNPKTNEEGLVVQFESDGVKFLESHTG
ncbi:MAG: zinc ribbon domain-containing protein [Ruminococcaceae bacterium]|nr:zinc ribbon domain-containing protein [Oscillospiraceae bacterium]